MSGLPKFRVVGAHAILHWPNGEDEYRSAIEAVEASEHWLTDDPWSHEARAAQQDQEDLDDLRRLPLDETQLDELICAAYQAKARIRARQTPPAAGYTIPDRQTSSRD